MGVWQRYKRLIAPWLLGLFSGLWLTEQAGLPCSNLQEPSFLFQAFVSFTQPFAVPPLASSSLAASSYLQELSFLFQAFVSFTQPFAVPPLASSFLAASSSSSRVGRR